MSTISRRRFVATSSAGLVGILATHVAPAVGQTREISYLCWNNFAPASDKKLAEIGGRFTKDTGIKLKIAETWEDLYKVGKELKKMGNPLGIAISQNYDTISTASAVLWCYGGKEIDKDGKTIAINSKATVDVVEWYKKMYRDCMEPEVLSWSDSSNSESLQQGKAGWIHNPVSAYIVARDRKLVTADGINHHKSLAGPAGRHDTDAPRSIGIWKFGKNIDASKEWIRYLLGKKDVYDEYLMSGGGFKQQI